jgi:hypothetical protein
VIGVEVPYKKRAHSMKRQAKPARLRSAKKQQVAVKKMSKKDREIQQLLAGSVSKKTRRPKKFFNLGKCMQDKGIPFTWLPDHTRFSKPKQG